MVTMGWPLKNFLRSAPAGLELPPRSRTVAITGITQHFSFHAPPESISLAEIDVEFAPPDLYPDLVGVADAEDRGYLTT